METNDALRAEIKRLQTIIKEKDAELEYLKEKLERKVRCCDITGYFVHL